MIRLPLDDRFKIDLGKPVLTLDVNQIALRAPSDRPSGYEYLAAIEWNYFETGLLEAAVTPETAFEITKGVPDEQLGSYAYERLTKSQWFKGRPSGSTLTLDEQESNELWLDMRHRLWPTVTDDLLTASQRADVNQLFSYSIASGSTVFNSAFVTIDHNFLNKASELRSAYGLSVMTPTGAWNAYHSSFGLVRPSNADVDSLWKQQGAMLARLRSGKR